MIFRLVCLAAALLAAVTPAARAGLLDLLLGKRDIEVITVTDMTPEGRERRPPTPQDPVHYVAVSLGFQELGGVVGGEKPPPKDETIRTISKALAKQGFLPATNASPKPTLVLVFAWGTLNADMEYGFDPDQPPIQRNRQQILKFLGGYKMGYSDRDFDPLTPQLGGVSFMDFDARDFYDLAAEDFYMAVVAAYDLEALQKKQKKLLWMTRISCPSRGFWMPEVLPTMLAMAGPHLGRETSRPVWVNASDKYKPDVQIGDPQLVEFLETGPLPVVEASTAAKKPASAPAKKANSKGTQKK
jgi:hypothetical protein